jgi:hypothetical protein
LTATGQVATIAGCSASKSKPLPAAASDSTLTAMRFALE